MTQSELEDLAQLRAFLRTGAATPVRSKGRVSLREAAAVVGVSPSTILRWETGERRPTGAAGVRYWHLLRGLMAA
jgi:DNA-binding transcriptional regulator YiaG